MKKIDKKLNQLIPGGAHTYSRGYDQFSYNTPGILKKAKGAYVYDNKNNKYLDYGMGLRSIILGYSDRLVNKEAIKQINYGNTLTRPSNIELKLATKIVNTFPYIDMVKFSKNSSNAVTAATKLARAYTKKKIILRCINHPFFSFDDWFIGSTNVSRGIPDEIANLTKTFQYNNIKSLKRNIRKYKNKVSCVVLEASTFDCPKLLNNNQSCCQKYNCDRNFNSPNFLKEVQKICKINNIVLIIDETITGFRWHFKGACHKYNIKPDLVIFGKAIANGFSLAVLGGNKKIMSLGSIDKPKSERVFLLSTTHGAEMSSLAAANQTIKMLSDGKKLKKIWEHGTKLIKNINMISLKHKMEKNIWLYGLPCSPYILTNIDNKNSFELKTLLQEELIKHKVLMPWISISFAHGDKEADYVIGVFNKIIPKIKKIIGKDIEKRKFKNLLKPVFRKYN
jgi:glutamate-1-semialdehyde 2,1-aminomutase